MPSASTDSKIESISWRAKLPSLPRRSGPAELPGRRTAGPGGSHRLLDAPPLGERGAPDHPQSPEFRRVLPGLEEPSSLRLGLAAKLSKSPFGPLSEREKDSESKGHPP